MCNISHDTENTIIILKSMAINYPILKGCQLELTKPLLVVVEKGQLKTTVNIFSDGNAPCISEYTRIKECKRIFSESNSTFVIYPYSHTRKGKEFLSFLSTVVMAGAIEETEINALPLVISEGIPIDCDLDAFFTVFIDGNLDGVHVDGMIAVPSDRQLTLVENKINALILDGFSQDKRALFSAVCFIYPSTLDSKCQFSFDMLLCCAEKLLDFDDDNKGAGNLGDVFISELYHFIEGEEFFALHELPNLEMCAVENFHQAVYFDSDFIFFKESFFKKIAEPLLRIFSLGVVKKALVQEGLLCPENTRTYSVKMPYYDLFGVYRRERMLRFKRSRLNCVGELDFIDLCRQM